VKARLAAGNIVRQNPRLVMNVKLRTVNRSTRIVPPKSTDISVVHQAARRLGIIHDGIEARAGTARFRNSCAPEFSMMLHLRFTVPRWNWRRRLQIFNGARTTLLSASSKSMV
jgi:hypothetical protein